MKVLLIGGEGYLGKHLQFFSKNLDIVVYTKDDFERRKPIRQDADVNVLLATRCHNANYTRELAEKTILDYEKYAQELNLRRTVFFSSSMVNPIIFQNQSLSVTTPYGQMKKKIERMAPWQMIIRPTTVYGNYLNVKDDRFGPNIHNKKWLLSHPIHAGEFRNFFEIKKFVATFELVLQYQFSTVQRKVVNLIGDDFSDALTLVKGTRGIGAGTLRKINKVYLPKNFLIVR